MKASKRKIASDKIRAGETYSADKAFMLDAIMPYKNAPREKTYELFNFFTAYANEQNWSTIRLDTVLHDIVVLNMKKDPTYSEDIYDLLTNYLDALEGWCSPSSRIVLKNDYWDDGD